MSLSKNTFVRGAGGLGRTTTNTDSVSGFIGYVSSVSGTSITASQGYKLFGVSDLKALGLTNTSIGETKASATDCIVLTSAGAVGDTLEIKFANYDGTTISLGVYTIATTTIATEVASLISFINSYTWQHGFVASAGGTTAKITLTCPSGLGIYPNTKSVTVSITGTATVGAIVAFSGGVASVLNPIYYHVSEYFRANPNGILYFMLCTSESDYSVGLLALQSFASGSIRRCGIYSTASFSTGKVTSLQSVATTLEGNNYNTPLSIIATFDFSGTAFASLPSLALSSKNVSISIGQDAGAKGFKIWNAQGKTVGSVGNAIGTRSAGKVSDSIGYKGKFNVTDGTELNVVSVGCTSNPNVNTLTPSQLDFLDNLRYLFLIKGKTIDGTFYNNGNTCIVSSSDYAYIENNETIDKVVRLINANLEPFQQSPIILNEDGTISDISANGIEQSCEPNLINVVSEGDISAFSLTVPTSQNVVSTGNVNVTVQIVPIAIARTFTINIGFTPKLA
jgi:hypothetical protein